MRVSSAGIDVPEGEKGNNLSEFSAKSADKIFVMEDYMKNIIINEYKVEPQKIISLNIHDIYYKDDPKLKEILREKLERYFNKI